MKVMRRALILATLSGLALTTPTCGQELSDVVTRLQEKVEIERAVVAATAVLQSAEKEPDRLVPLARQIKETRVDVVQVIGLYTVSNILTNTRAKGPLRKVTQLDGEPIPEANFVDGGISPDFFVDMFGSVMQKESRFQQSVGDFLEKNTEDGVLKLLKATVENYSQDGLNRQRNSDDTGWSFPWCVLIGCKE